MKPAVTVGFVMRDRLAVSARMLQRLYDTADMPFSLILVDVNLPDCYRRQITEVIRDRPNVRVIRLDRFVFANAARNIVVAESRDDFICLFENDCRAEPGWLSPLVETASRYPAGVLIAPLVWEGEAGSRRMHHDVAMDALNRDGDDRWVLGPNPLVNRGMLVVQTEVPSIEAHVFLGSRVAFERMGPLDPLVNTRDCLDLTLTARSADVSMILEPRSAVCFSSHGFLPTLEPEECDFWFFNRAMKKVAFVNEYVKQKWKLAGVPDSIAFRRDTHYYVDEEIRKMHRANSVPRYYFAPLRRAPGVRALRRRDGIGLQDGWGREINLNATGAVVWENLDRFGSFEELAFSFKKSYPEHRASMIQDLAAVVDDLIACGVVRAGPLPWEPAARPG